jgi:co-chaperonin GroES (HSP10)
LTSADSAEVSKGVVLAIGDECEDIKVGDTILPNWQKARPTKFEGTDFYIVNEDDVVLVFEE